MINIAVFASGKGSNFQNIINYFESSKLVKISLLVTDKEDCGAIDIAKKSDINHKYFSKMELKVNPNLLVNTLQCYSIDLIVLAGYLTKIPKAIIEKFPNAIINIHPALLPKYGGKGMYGNYVHQAVLDNHEKITGITIHLVTEEYDEGTFLLQASAPLHLNDNVQSIAEKVHYLEYEFYPKTIETWIKQWHKLSL